MPKETHVELEQRPVRAAAQAAAAEVLVRRVEQHERGRQHGRV